MTNWQVVPRRVTVKGVKFRLHGNGHTLTVYIGSGVRKQIKGYKSSRWCNVYTRGDYLMVQLVCVSDNNSRRLGTNMFSLPYSVVSKHWQDGRREKEIPAKVEKGNLILMDLKDLGR